MQLQSGSSVLDGMPLVNLSARVSKALADNGAQFSAHDLFIKHWATITAATEDGEYKRPLFSEFGLIPYRLTADDPKYPNTPRRGIQAIAEGIAFALRRNFRSARLARVWLKQQSTVRYWPISNQQSEPNAEGIATVNFVFDYDGPLDLTYVTGRTPDA